MQAHHAEQLVISPVREPERVIVVGGSRGSLPALVKLLEALPADLPAAVLVVMHVAVGSGSWGQALEGTSRLPVQVADHTSELLPGNVYLAPAGLHLVVAEQRLRVIDGPRENASRPSIDVLFRSAAVEFGNRVIGVILSGGLTDGAVGLSAVLRCGGIALVQDPAEALDNELPRQALQTNAASRKVPTDAIGALLCELVASEPGPALPVPDELRVEARIAFRSMAHTAIEGGNATAAMGEATHFSCPECLGPLWLIAEGPFGRYRCDIGHAYTAEALLADQERQLERALWLAYRTLIERHRILLKMAQDGRAKGLGRSAEAFEERALEFNEHAVAVRNAMSLLGSPPNPGGELILEDTSNPSI